MSILLPALAPPLWQRRLPGLTWQGMFLALALHATILKGFRAEMLGRMGAFLYKQNHTETYENHK